MNQNQEPELTEWATGSPPCEGWWKTRRRSSPSLLQPQRRWFYPAGGGLPGTWSLPVSPNMSDERAEERKHVTSVYSDDIEWCGLKVKP